MRMSRRNHGARLHWKSYLSQNAVHQTVTDYQIVYMYSLITILKRILLTGFCYREVTSIAGYQ